MRETIEIAVPPEDDYVEPSVLGGKYRLLRKLGEGGMGAVYEAENLLTHGPVAIKVISGEDASADTLARFQREAQAAATIQSQHIVRVFDVGIDEATRQPFMVMEKLEGVDVSRVLKTEHQLNEDVVRRIAVQTCLGLGAAHRAGIVHRDIKPANIFLAKQDMGDFVVKILDFGIAKLRVDHLGESQEHGLTKTGTLVGSPHYMSPEQARGARHLDARADIWSLGVTLYRMLTGEFPHDGETLGEIILSICSAPAKSVHVTAPWVTSDLAAVVKTALRRTPADRFQTAEEMAEAIRAIGAVARSIRPDALRAPSDLERSSSSAVIPQTAIEAELVIADTDVSHRDRTSPDDQTLGTQVTSVGDTNTFADPIPAKRKAWIPVVAISAAVLAGIAVGVPLALRSSPVSASAARPSAESVDAPVVKAYRAPDPAAPSPPSPSPETATSAASVASNARDAGGVAMTPGPLGRGALGDGARVSTTSNAAQKSSPAAVSSQPQPGKLAEGRVFE